MTSETQVQPQTLPIGYQLEDYRVTAVLGQGGFGITYKAADETLRRDVAIKEYLPRQFAFRDATGQVHARSQDDEGSFHWGLDRFVDEGRALAMFRHPNIASVIRYIQQNGTAYLVMEFEEGMDLEHWLASRDRPEEERLVHGILVPVLEGLARVHDKGLLHRDIKPDNIFIRRDGSPVLIDFGASRLHSPEATSKLTSIISAGYSPFEQYGTGERQGPWSDLYALAGTMYRAISGGPPVDAINRHQGAPLEPAMRVGAGRYGKPFLEAIDQALSLEIRGRPQSAREFLSLLGVEPPPAPADPDATVVNRGRPPPGGAAGKARSRRTLAAAIVLLVAAGAAAGGYYLLAPLVVDRAVPLAVGQQTPPAVDSDGARRTSRDNGSQDNGGAPTADAEGLAPNATGGANAAADTGPAAPAAGAKSGAGAESAEAAEPAAADLRNEDLILAGLDLSPNVRNFRETQLASAMLEYTRIKTAFDRCRDSGCAQLQGLLGKLQKTLEPQPWRRADVEGSVTIQNPRRLLDNADCPFMLDVVEEIKVSGEDRQQVRTYCTTDGFHRVVEDARKVS